MLQPLWRYIHCTPPYIYVYTTSLANNEATQHDQQQELVVVVAPFARPGTCLFPAMSTNLNYKQVANVTRRTWDVETYEKRAQARQEGVEKGETVPDAKPTATTRQADEEDKQEFRPALEGAAGPEGSDRAFLKSRSAGIMQDLEAQVGQSTFVDTSGGPDKTDGVTATGVGWHCKVCDCYLKDSHTYLDHINGRKHQRKLGFSMRVERSTADDLKRKLQALQRKKEAASAQQKEVIDFAARVEEKDLALQEKKEERRRRRKERKQKAREQQQEEGDPPSAPPKADGEQPTQEKDQPQNEGNEDEQEPQIDPALAAMMGFSSFA